MSLIALLAGLSASAYRAARRNYGLSASGARIQAVLRAARNTSISSGTPSFVVVDPVRREVWAQCYEPIAEWSFEESTGFPQVPGRIGSAAGVRGRGAIDCGDESRFALRYGVAIDAWVRHELADPLSPPERSSKRAPRRFDRARRRAPDEKTFAILEKAGAYSLGMTSSGALVGTIGGEVVTTEDDVVSPHRWVFVSMSFDGDEIRLSADGVERSVYFLSSSRGSLLDDENAAARLAAESEIQRLEIPRSEHSLTISSSASPFPGDIDEVKLRGRTDRLLYQYPEHEHIVGWTKRIHFDRRGHLDPAYHDGGIRVVLVELTDDQLDVRARRKDGSRPSDYAMTFDEWRAAQEFEVEHDEVFEENRLLEGAYASMRRVEIEIDRLGTIR